MLQVNHTNTITRCEISSKLITEAPKRQRRRSGVFVVNFERTSDLFLVFVLLFEQVNIYWAGVIKRNYPKNAVIKSLSSKIIYSSGGHRGGVAYRRRGSNLLQIMLPERVHRLKNFQICFFGRVTNSVSFYWLRNFFSTFSLRGSNLKTLFVKFFFELILIIWECM